MLINQKKLSSQREGRCSGLKKVHPYSCMDKIKTSHHLTHPLDPKVEKGHSFNNMGAHESPSKQNRQGEMSKKENY